jgi:RNA polymerase sigma-70 factor (ECF subfamily)
MKPSKDEKNRSRKNPEHEETELILRLKEGDHQSFEALYYLYKNRLLLFLVLKIRSTKEAEDILQDVFLKIWIERENLDKIISFNSYIFKITKNRMFDYFRKFSSTSTEEISSSDIIIEESIENIFLKQEQQQILQEAVTHLPTQQKKICKLHYEQEIPLKDIAKEMNISISAVQNAINKANKNIRKYIAKKKYF